MKRAIAFLSVFALCIACAMPAFAQDDEREFLLGTQLVIKSPGQLSDPMTNWWAELLPMEYNYAQGSIVKAVNAARAARGETEMIDYKNYPIAIGGEMPIDGGSYEYNIDFMRMTPTDVAVVMAAFPFTGVMSDLQTEQRPIRTGWFYANSPEGNATLTIFGESETFTRDDSPNAAKVKAAALLERVFGKPLQFDLSFNCYESLGGYNSLDINITVYLDGAGPDMPGMPRPFEGEGGI